jgi:hypothetical protein
MYGSGQECREYSRTYCPLGNLPAAVAVEEYGVALAGKHGSAAPVGQSRSRALVREQ